MDHTLSPWKRFLGLLDLERKDIFQVAYYAIFEGLSNLYLPIGIQAIINLLQGAQISTSWIILIILVTTGVAFSGMLKLMQIRIIETIQQRIFTRASFELSFRFPKIKANELRDCHLPELANRFFDTLIIQKGFSKILIDVPSAFLQILFALILLSFYHPFFIIFGLILVFLIYIVFRYTIQKGLDTSLKESKNKYKVVHWLQEISRAVISFKLSGKTSLAMDKTDTIVNSYLSSRENHFKILMLQFIQMVGFKVVMTTGLLLIGGFLVLDQRMNIGQFVASEIIIILVMNSVEKLTIGLESFYDTLTSIEKLGQIVDKPIENQKGEVINTNSDIKIELKDISYHVISSYNPVLANVSLTIKPKDRILIIGESGAGKSTLLRLISGIINPTSGFIYINDLSLDSILINSYRQNIGLFISEETPFQGTIRENVTFGDVSIEDSEIVETFKNIGLLEFLKQQPKGLNTGVNPEGKHIPNTIIKKLLLARAIVKKPKILILDNPLESFNREETEKVITYLSDESHNWSLVVVSNNPYWKNKCSQQITFENGRMIDIK